MPQGWSLGHLAIVIVVDMETIWGEGEEIERTKDGISFHILLYSYPSFHLFLSHSILFLFSSIASRAIKSLYFVYKSFRYV